MAVAAGGWQGRRRCQPRTALSLRPLRRIRNHRTGTRIDGCLESGRWAVAATKAPARGNAGNKLLPRVLDWPGRDRSIKRPRMVSILLRGPRKVQNNAPSGARGSDSATMSSARTARFGVSLLGRFALVGPRRGATNGSRTPETGAQSHGQRLPRPASCRLLLDGQGPGRSLRMAGVPG